MCLRSLGAVAVSTVAASFTISAPVAAAPIAHPAVVAPAAAQQLVTFPVHLPLRNEQQLEALVASQSDSRSPLYHHFLTPAQFRAAYGPTQAQIDSVVTTLRAAGFTIRSIGTQEIQVQGTVSLVERNFGTRLVVTRSATGHLGTASLTPLRLPRSLAMLGASIPAFSPVSHHRVHATRVTGPMPLNRYSPIGGYWFDDLKQAYSYPSFQTVNGAGRTIAVLMASNFENADIAAYFAHELLPTPKLARRVVDGGAPFDPNSGASLEVELDIEQSGGMAPGATIIDYNIPDLSDASIFDGYAAIIDDNVADIVNSSFGGCELFYTKAYNGGVDYTYILQDFHDLFLQGNAQGITFVASAGDNGALGCTNVEGTRFTLGVENPADDPNVTGVGGTNLVTTFTPKSLTSKYVSENAYPDPLDPAQVGAAGGVWGSGGGKSVIFRIPPYQHLVNTGDARDRTIPDVALHMGGCPLIALQPCGANRSYDIEAFAGAFYGVIGTSASSPDFAGLLALKEQVLGGARMGNENWDIYQLAALNPSSPFKFFRPWIQGNNGFYKTKVGYNYVLGNGTVIGKNFALLPNDPGAGNPQTPTNP